MPKTIQIRNVPEELPRTLKARATAAGMTLSDYLLLEIEQVAAKPTMKEWLERVANLEPSKWMSRRRSSRAGCGTPTIPAASVRPLSPLRLQLRRPAQRLEDHAVLLRLAPQVI